MPETNSQSGHERDELETRPAYESGSGPNPSSVTTLSLSTTRSSFRNSISARLTLVLVTILILTSGAIAFFNIRAHRRDLETATLGSAERMSDIIKRSTSYYMLHNDRTGLYEMMRNISEEPGVVRLRIINEAGRVSYSTDSTEVGSYVDKSAEACYACHAQAQPLTKLNRPDRFRIFKGNSHRVLAIITPIENKPECSNAACHAHPASQQILGTLDTHLSLATADARVAAGSQQMVAYTFIAIGVTALLIWVFIGRMLHVKLLALKAGTQRLGSGDLGYQIEVRSKDELGDLAGSFNDMSQQLLDARTEVTQWAHTLEDRVQLKTRELKRAHEQMIQVEKMASIGKMAAVVAHEINNPLSGILTYSKLMKKWVERGIDKENRRDEMYETLDLIASESRRCGELVKNLLSFSRTSPMNLEKVNLNQIIDRCVRLVHPRTEMQNIQVQLAVDDYLPTVFCDGAQIEQVLLALIMNAIDAMPHGGNLWLGNRVHDEEHIELEVRDDGIGIPQDLLPRLFEPFTTTKEVGKGVGLGLAISRNIVDRHSGRIEVESEPGRGTRFRIILPLDSRVAEEATRELTAKA